ncbi:MAG TPA: phospholipase D-like domain-containing protein [Candidatus Nitrosotenuis sp.]|jgi:phosphatidylserine/phosphatidylglycerophosphate/cardiolipin synthase-like enzyme|nr:phospholipase D-like domain-containing protein [Candidatus Nitrosotenuis sp.]
MDSIDPRVYSHLVSQGLIPGGPRRRPAASAEAPEDRFSQGAAESLGLIPRGAAASGSDFQLGDKAESLEALAALRREGVLDQLKDARRVLRGRLAQGRDLQERAGAWSQLQDVQGAVHRIEEAHRALQFDEKVDPEGRASPLARSYFIHGTTPVAEMKEVLATLDSLRQPDSPLRLPGNQVDPLVRGEIWKAKMDLLEQAARRGTDPIDAEYYELSSPDMLEKLGRAARAGAPVRVLMDPGKLNPLGDGYDAGSLASRLNALRRLEEGSGGRAGVQLFANKEVLGADAEIMHRKLLRVGDQVIFGGMNANPGSGENVDVATRIRGPAAARLAQSFEADLEASRGSTPAQIYGQQLERLRSSDRPVTVGPRGLLDLLEAQISGPARPGESFAERLDRVLESASYQGLRPSQLAEIPDADGDGRISAQDERAFLLGQGRAELTPRGRNLLADGLEQAVERINRPENQERLARSLPPDASPVGSDTVAVGDTSPERQALVLHAIESARRYVKVSAFVLTEDLARLLVEKKQQMEAQGRPFEVQVVLDPGLYPHGGSPNEKGYRYLEDHGVPVKWAALARTDPDHDRKVHAKMILTDQMMLTGSTNFSKKGLRDNWELSDITWFGDQAESRARQAQVEADFDRLYQHEALGLDTRALSEARFAGQDGEVARMQKERYRSRLLRAFMQGIEDYEKEMGQKIQAESLKDPVLAYTVHQRAATGQAPGYATLEALGPERLAELRKGSAAWQELEHLRSNGL